MTQTKAELLQTRNQGDIRLGDSDSSHYVGFKAPATVSSSLVWTLPAADGSSNQYLKTDGSGALSWGSDTAGMPTSGGTFTGDVTFTGDSANVVFDKSDSALEFANNAKATFGDSLNIYFDGSNSTLLNTTGEFILRDDSRIRIRTDQLIVNSGDNSDSIIFAEKNGSVELYEAGTKRFETSTTGATVTGTLVATAFTGALTGNVTGNCSGSAGTVTGAAQTAITSVGTLSSLVISGDLTVNGTTTTIDTTTLRVEDKNIEIGKVSTPSDTTADGGGLTLLGTTNKTFNWVNSTDAWTSSEHIQVASGKRFIGDGSTITNVNATTLDSIDSGSFARSDTEDTITGKFEFTTSGSFPLKINGSDDSKIKLSGSSNPKIQFQEGTTDKAYLQFHSNGMLYFANQETNTQIRLGGSPAFYDGSTYQTIWHAGNDGAGSGLDADRIDGLTSDSFLRSNAADTAANDITFDGGAGAVTIGGNSDIRFTNGNWTGNTYGKIELHGNSLYFSGGSTTAYSFIFRYDGQDRVYIKSNGTIWPQSDSTSNLGENDKRWSNVYADTLYGDGSNLTNLPASGGSTPTVKTSNYTASSGDYVFVNASGLTITLPSSPSAGDSVKIRIIGTNYAVIARNSSNIESAAENFYHDLADKCATFTYANSSLGWQVGC